ncbi:MAG: sigma-70 family RNA polymerase sigma factor [Planctomycetota bacterium]|nr:sigma-70 family RNA polymerase sigma factor [Planctomycetota bacterium]
MSHPSEDIYPEDFMRIYRETITPLYRYVSRRCGNDRSLAEDVTQETYLRAVNHWRDGKQPDKPIAWLQYVAHNLLVNHFSKKRPDSLDPTSLDRMLDPATSRDFEAAATVQFGFSKLSEKKKRLLEAYYLEGKAVRTIAQEMNLSERAVEGRLRRSRRALRKQLNGIVDYTGGTT